MVHSFFKPIVLSLTLLATGCCNFGRQTEAQTIGSMSEVLKSVRTELRASMPKNTKEDPAIGLQISKLTATFKVTAEKVAGSELKLSIVQPVGSIGGSVSASNSQENTIVVEYGWPAETVFEICPSSSVDSLGRTCKPGDKVKIPTTPPDMSTY